MRRPLLLDTCALVWLATGDKALSEDVRRAIDAAPAAHVSAISAWEVGIKAERGQLSLPLAPLTWFRRVCEQHGLAVIDVTPEIACRANELPWHHRDPADRFIVATAQLHRLHLVTADRRIAAYGVPTLI